MYVCVCNCVCVMLCMYICIHSNWSSVYAHSYEPELVHDILDPEECYEDEDDSNGGG